MVKRLLTIKAEQILQSQHKVQLTCCLLSFEQHLVALWV